MSKFKETLTASNSDLKEKRADNLTKKVSNAQTSLVRNLEDEILDLEMQIDKLGDLGPNSTTSLKVGENVNGKKWVDQMQSLKLDLFIKNRELEVAKATQKEWFE
ncbi:MAG: hypothetical protein WD512_16120 [Candidatus Paceibacterota bacterium]